MKRELITVDTWLIANALRAAADQYKTDATKALAEGARRVADAFSRQQIEVLQLADSFEQADFCTLQLTRT